MTVRTGSCSWAEKTLIQSREFYPKGVSTPEERLRHYAARFDCVEVDSSYYAIPAARTSQLWADRTPPDFIFHMKAYGPLTGHGAELSSMPEELRAMLPAEVLKGRRVALTDKGARDAAFRLFKDALGPLRNAQKLGIIVFQYPPFFVYKKENLDYILFCREMMEGFRIGIEFRHGSWLAEDRRDQVFGFLRRHDLIYIAADEPQYGSMATVPFVAEATSDCAYLRLHGRNTANWLRKGIETSERYNYLYQRDELLSFIPHIERLNRRVQAVYVMFNNCHGVFSMRNAEEMKQLLREKDIS